MRILFFSLLCILGAPYLEGSYFTHPPTGWQVIEDRSQLPERVLVLFVGQGRTRFAPTLYLACDPLNQNITNYIHQAMTYHQQNSKTDCQDLGEIQTHEGTAYILKLDSPSIYGEMTLLQAYIPSQGKVYVLTGISLRSEFASFSKVFYETLCSFSLTL